MKILKTASYKKLAQFEEGGSYFKNRQEWDDNLIDTDLDDGRPESEQLRNQRMDSFNQMDRQTYDKRALEFGQIGKLIGSIGRKLFRFDLDRDRVGEIKQRLDSQYPNGWKEEEIKEVLMGYKQEKENEAMSNAQQLDVNSLIQLYFKSGGEKRRGDKFQQFQQDIYQDELNNRNISYKILSAIQKKYWDWGGNIGEEWKNDPEIQQLLQGATPPDSM